jgi:adenylate kinase
LTLCGLLTCPAAFASSEAGPVVLVLGPPGGGKTVNAKKISERYRVPMINMADLLKEAGGWGKAGSSKKLRAPVESGDLLNDEMAIRLFEQRLGKSDVKKGFVLDGFPLTAKQAEYLENISTQLGLRQPVVVHLTVSDSTATQRMLQRGRSDDKPEIIERRLAEYHTQSDLVLKRYQQVVTINTTGPPNEVWRNVEQSLEPILPKRRR